MDKNFPDKKYLIVREDDGKVVAESYDESFSIQVALAMQDRYVDKYEIVTAKSEKYYKKLSD